ncbi:MAG TPA: type II toxin-antitoxin system VapC family toxin [Anaerolineae bacterium]|nr:type II toxin-antitoxin system VapC family toxin [Anaerolineae bacterium]
MNWPPTPLVIDANVCLYTLAPLPEHEQAKNLMASLLRYERPWYAPGLWRVEVLSGLRKIVAAHLMTRTEMGEAVSRFWEWPVQVLPEDRELLERALRWSERIGHRVIYDSVYLALADGMNAELWTADRRLYQRARRAGADFVRLFPDDTP